MRVRNMNDAVPHSQLLFISNARVIARVTFGGKASSNRIAFGKSRAFTPCKL